MPDAEHAYKEWSAAVHAPAMSRRTADRNARFLLPHLQPGMRLLDIGCGGGSITIGLAAAVAPGEVAGVDVSEPAIAAARKAGVDVKNLIFEIGDALALPFDDGSFDVVFCHAVLQHLESPLQALREARRVLRPGGVIGVADADFDGAIIAPTNEWLDKAAAVLARTRRNPRIGKELRSLLHQAGFSRIVGSASAAYRGVQSMIEMDARHWADYFAAPPFVGWAVLNGWATREDLAAISAAYREWGNDPGAFSAAFWCEALGWAE